MESKTKRTLVKSAPELWALADDLARMEAWMAGVVGRRSQAVSVEVTHRERERMLAWRTSGSEAGSARIALELAEKEFGTSVSIVAQHSRPHACDVDAALEQLLDELGSPERRPFERA
jgi:hypothetical protein